MNEMPSRSGQEPSSTRPGRPALHPEARRRLLQVFPDLDPEMVAEVLGLTESATFGATRSGAQSDQEHEK